MKGQKIILEITPKSHIRSTQGDKILFRIPKEKRNYNSQKRVERLEKYNDYKASLRALAKQKGFELPSQGASIKFYLPVPKSERKWKQKAMHNTLHQCRPDIDNLTKGFFDGLMSDDAHIGHIEAAKFWVNNPTGWIEIIVKEPLYAVFSHLGRKPDGIA